MVQGFWKIPVPADGPEVVPDLTLAPLVGWDPAGFRLGYGGGYFDRTLAVLLRPGETLFLQQQVRIGADRFFPIPAAEAAALLARCDYSLLIDTDGEEPAPEAPADGPAAPAQ
mgnify:CR=1 FL=1